MIGIRIFAAYLGVVWFLLGWGSTLDLYDRVVASLEAQEMIEDAADKRLDAYKKGAERMEEDAKVALEVYEKQVEVAEEALEALEEAGGQPYTNAVAMVARAKSVLEEQRGIAAQAMKDAERTLDDVEEAADKAEDDVEEASATGIMDWVRAIGASLVGVLMIAFAWRGPPLTMGAVRDGEASSPSPSPSPLPSQAPAAGPQTEPETSEDIALEIDE
jgi:hypothetical protein